ncbi:hypothetical protein FGO68_gene2702 [Halteria grandinella]|uniref:Elongation factor G, mitochondrial n=1 Tax=Halteria grandinella TaxID=5974 RepID=A0A8J8P4F8_HALGN|nr:hypothetical protein FGO68_gene2702 [Halteria grandinella]
MQSRAFSIADPNIMRNIGISAHIDSGKTTLTERILYYTGRIDEIHEVKGSDNVGAKMDSMELEREKGITIKSAATYCEWKDHHVNIIDTPGHVDFTVEVERALRVLDGAILLVCGASGVQPQTLTVDKQMKRYSVPRVIFINKLDRMGADPWFCITSVKERLGLNAAAVQVNIGIENGLQGVVDLVKMKALYFEGENGDNIVEKEIPEDLVEMCKEKKLELLASLADHDPEIEEYYLNEDINIPIDVLKKSIRQLTIEQKFCPVYMGSAYKNKGVQPLLDGVIDYLPRPTEVKNYAFDIAKNNEKVMTEIDNKKPFVGLAFKLEESQFGQLTYVRIYQGKLKKGATLNNTATKKKVKISRMVRMHSNEMEDINEAGAGDIFAIFGVDCASGETFCDQTINWSMQSMHVPEPVMSLTIKPKKTDQLELFLKALNRFQREDPTFVVKQNMESEEIIISGMGELHLFIYCERMKREYDVDLIIGNPTVNYRETITHKATFNFLHKKQSGGAGQYAKVIGYIEPKDQSGEEADLSCQFMDKTEGQNIPNEYIPSIEKAFHECTKKGPQTGYPVVGVNYVLTDGQTHPVDSSSLAFGLATKYSFREAFQKAGPQILEPVMNVEVTVPSECQGSIMGQLVRRRGTVTNTQTKTGLFILNADVPLAAMFGYATELRGATQGLGEFSMEYKMHSPVGEFEVADVIEAYKKKRADKDEE